MSGPVPDLPRVLADLCKIKSRQGALTPEQEEVGVQAAVSLVGAFLIEQGLPVEAALDAVTTYPMEIEFEVIAGAIQVSMSWPDGWRWKDLDGS